MHGKVQSNSLSIRAYFMLNAPWGKGRGISYEKVGDTRGVRKGYKIKGFGLT